MNVFAVPRLAVAQPTLHFRMRIAAQLRRALDRLHEIDTSINQRHAERDRQNQAAGTVDGAFWVYLR